MKTTAKKLRKERVMSLKAMSKAFIKYFPVIARSVLCDEAIS
jgi:hypothetical protein